LRLPLNQHPLPELHSVPNDLRAAPGGDAARFYFMDIAVPRAFVERFACGLAVVTMAFERR
jgi:hypothetical protein